MTLHHLIVSLFLNLENKDTYKNNNFNHKSKQLMQDKGTEYQYGFISHYNK